MDEWADRVDCVFRERSDAVFGADGREPPSTARAGRARSVEQSPRTAGAGQALRYAGAPRPPAGRRQPQRHLYLVDTSRPRSIAQEPQDVDFGGTAEPSLKIRIFPSVSHVTLRDRSPSESWEDGWIGCPSGKLTIENRRDRYGKCYRLLTSLSGANVIGAVF